jgi:hypothetical protein
MMLGHGEDLMTKRNIENQGYKVAPLDRWSGPVLLDKSSYFSQACHK